MALLRIGIGFLAILMTRLPDAVRLPSAVTGFLITAIRDERILFFRTFFRRIFEAN